MELNQILSLVGKTIYVVEQDLCRRQVADNTFVVTGELILKCSEWEVTEIRFPSDPYAYSGFNEKKYEVVFIYNLEYDDCYDFFGIDDIGKTVFFTEEDAKKKIEELNSIREKGENKNGN